ncbi:HEAT repeat domain-containing protein [Dactylosporangium sp. NPDC049742]|uniref:HEAT repeat domain-containing protein n=1 Tax=Dactylosporangium sp. NPDC049742 TaxID=3154737 RepID=UPI00343FA2EB
MADLQAALADVLASIDDITVRLRPGVVQELAASGDLSLVPPVQAALERCLDDEDYEGVELLAEILAGLRGTRAFPLLLRAVARPVPHEWEGLKATLAGLMEADPAGCRPTALAFTAERHRELRCAGLWALEHLVTLDDFELLDAAMHDEDWRVRGTASGALSELYGDERVLPALVRMLQDPELRLRSSTLLILGYYGDLAALDSMVALRHDPSVLVREVLSLAVAQLVVPTWRSPRQRPGPPATPAQVETARAALRELLHDENQSVRGCANLKLGTMTHL